MAHVSSFFVPRRGKPGDEAKGLMVCIVIKLQVFMRSVHAAVTGSRQFVFRCRFLLRIFFGVLGIVVTTEGFRRKGSYTKVWVCSL